MAGTNHELVVDITSGTSDISSGGKATPRVGPAPEGKAGTVTLKVFEQSWTNTLSVTSATLEYSVSQFSYALMTTRLHVPAEGRVLDARAFATLDAQAVAEEAACEDHSATVRCAYSPTSWCGANGNTYDNRCMARAACQFDATRDACPQPAACVPNPMRPCPFNWAPVCGKDLVTYSNRCAVRRRPPARPPYPATCVASHLP